MKKFFITLMCIVMVVCFMPTVAMAGTQTPCSMGGECTHVAAIGNTHYDTLAEAIVGAQSGQTVQLLTNVGVDNYVMIDKNITLDLNGQVLKNDAGPALWVVNADVLITGKGTISSNNPNEGYAVAWLGNGSSNATLTIDKGVTVCGSAEYGIAIFGINNATTNLIVNGKVKTTGAGAAISGNGSYNPASITINDGATVECTRGVGIYFPQKGTLTVNGGTITGTQGIQMCSGTLKISGSPTITATGTDSTGSKTGDGPIPDGAAISVVNRSYPGGVPSATISGTPTIMAAEGQQALRVYTWNANKVNNWDNASVSVTGGTFSSNVSNYVPEGTEVVEKDGIFTLEPADNAVAQVGDAGFTSLEAAIDAAADGDTVTLLGDVTLTKTQNVAKNITIDFDTHSITGNDVRVFNVQNGTLTLTGVGTITSIREKELNYASSVIRVGNDSGERATAGLVIGKDVVISAPSTYGVTVFGLKTTETVTVYGKVQCSSDHVGDAAAISGVGSEGYGGTTINIEPGAVVSSKNDVAIYHPQAGILNIKGGTISGKGGIEAKSGTINVTGTPTITATDKEIRYKYNGNGTSTSGYAIAVVENSGYAGGTQVNISGGTYTGAVEVVKDSNVEAGKKGAISITGGTFSTDPTEYVPANSNYRVRTNSNGTYTVYHYTPYVPSIPTDSLKTARTEAIKAVTDYVNPADYEEAQQAEIKTIVDNAKKNIEAAKTADEIKAIEAAAKAELDKLETAEEMSLIRAIGETKFVARSKAVTLKNGKKAIKITWYDKNGKEVKFDGVEIFRSTKRYSGYGKEPIYVSKSGVYYNTAIEAGTKYYYKVRGYVLVNGEKVYTDYSTKAWRTA